jgi:hypothetical protein
LRGLQFADDDKVKGMEHGHLHTQPKKFFYGIRKVVDCWTKCIEKQVDYAEK